MDFYYNKLKNPKFLKILFKMSIFSVLACFLALFAGTMNGTVKVEDNKGLKQQVILTNDNEKNIEILKSNKEVNLSDFDDVSFSESGGEKACYIKRAIDFKLNIYEPDSGTPNTINVKSKPGATLKEALYEAGFSLGEDDELIIEKAGVEPKPEKEGGLSRDVSVEGVSAATIKKVKFEIYSEQREIDYDVEEKCDDSVEEGKTKVEVKGEKGIVEIKLRKKIMCGKADAPQQEGDGEVLKEPKKAIVIKGTKKKETKNDGNVLLGKKRKRSDSKPVEISKPASPPGRSGTVSGFATSYRVGKTTSQGTNVCYGTVAGDPKVIPYGAIVEVFHARTGKPLYKGQMLDYCPTAVRGNKGVVVDLYGANIGRVPVRVNWSM